jgi:4-aminobutyrate aminotransferase-like enzyme/Ser/Thr protein kinase RdoA (MazF antagonist)
MPSDSNQRSASHASAAVLESKAPAFSAPDAERIAGDTFGVHAAARPLESERDQNFRLRSKDGREFVLKIANSSEDPAIVDFQTRALLHVAACDPAFPVPRVFATAAGEHSQVVEAPDGRSHIVRLLSYLHGSLLGEVPHPPPLLRNVGDTLARLGRALRGFYHPAAGYELLWDLKHAARLREHARHIEDASRRRLADRVLERFEARVLPRLPGLRAQVIHNDVGCNNALVDAGGEVVAGIFDFGDMVHAPLVNDVAVTLAEMILDEPDPMAAAMHVVAGYHAVEPLREEELALLFDLTAARLAVGVAISAWRVKDHAENRDYIAGYDRAFWAMLERLADMDPDVAHDRFREACGLSPLARPVGAAPAEGLEAREEDVERLLERRVRLLGPALSHFYDRPVHVVRGRGAWLIDVSGRAYLDAYNNVPHVGHCHPAVVEAIARQAATLNTNTRYLYESVLDYAERLAASMPASLQVSMFVNSGSEANDLAWRLAKAHTGQRGAIVVAGAYHGATDAVNDLSPSELASEDDLAPHVRTIPAPDGYRGAWRRGEPRLGERYAAAADDAIASMRANGLAPAAFFLDTLLASSGVVIPPAGYLAAVFERVRAAGGLCVADEVQAGFGRTGDHMWGFEAHGVVPDIVTLGKPIGNGHPVAAVVTRPEIVASLASQGEFFSTFGGNPVACAAGLAVLEVIEREGLRENAQRVGARLRTGIETLAKDRSLIGDVRGAGLFAGVELVRDHTTLEPAAAEARAVVNRMRDDGVLIGLEGPLGNVLKIRPPLVFSEANADRLLEALDRALGAL